ncbi:MAG TPA: hypothetical protein VE783_12735 [Candidatus Limnocylindrales bacterium]|nr:hypothetical protein [Candidatus Limnocylindrales bacterium]
MCWHSRGVISLDFRYRFAYYVPMPSLIFPDAWVVECAGCRCVITCFALDPQTEHMNQSTAPPATSAQVACPCCLGTYRYGEKAIRRGKIQPNPACRRKRDAQPSAHPGGTAGASLSPKPAATSAPTAFAASSANQNGAKHDAKLDGALLVGACLIAAIRMGSAEVRPSPKLTFTVSESVRLAREVLGELQRSR